MNIGGIMYKVAFIDDGIMEGIQEVPEKTKKYKISNGILQKRRNPRLYFVCLMARCVFGFFQSM